ncbi:MAG: chromate transporter [Erysipelotrichaceae bacterium]|nr:chromate transporter [Erysipelotrichaceae bacterium]
MNIFLKMFSCFFQIGLFSFGGGYAAVPLLQSLVVERYGWLSLNEFINLITIAEMTPGPIVINSATFVGMKLAGIFGALVSTLGSVLPSLIIVLFLSYLYVKYKNIRIVQRMLGRLRPVIVSMILAAGLKILIMALFNADSYTGIIFTDLRLIELVLFAIGLFLLRKYKLNPILIIFGSGVIGTVLYLI